MRLFITHENSDYVTDLDLCSIDRPDFLIFPVVVLTLPR
jgi:hypothetical protein